MKNILSAVRRHGILICLVKLIDSLISLVSSIISTFWLKTWLVILNCSYGKGLRMDGRFVLRTDEKGAIKIGDNVRMLSRFSSNLSGLTNPIVLACIGKGRISVGDYSGLSSAVLSAKSGITIGKRVLIGANVRIFDHDFHSLNYTERGAFREGASSPISIGDDVFIGTNAVILKGVKIGNRSIIGAGAVVAGLEIPCDSLVAGNPAKIIERFVE